MLRSPADLPPRDRSQGGVETGLFNSHSFSVTDLCLGKAELRPETRGCFMQGRTEEWGGAPPGHSGPSPPHALPFCNFPCVQSIFRGWISISYSFSSGGDFETQEKWGNARRRQRASLFHPQGLALPQAPGRWRKAMRPKRSVSPRAAWTPGAAQSQGSSAVVWVPTSAAGGSVQLLPPSGSRAPALGRQLSRKRHRCSALTYRNTTGQRPLAN
ncbi:unnamed protein product [Rangifer tarandus platyrhynchus]|uniref:Uncharacterized protein n=2 Tax=Rangifer tarandus platyrhynchus TaxID=3082113 RepID=A0ACB0DPI9_RANTA|nr:unnamed protein product [Rangifer tarandus platyrhynchus]CAI9690183.1 unnamed protein product [Rangifer tarandus platyrhynchus]